MLEKLHEKLQEPYVADEALKFAKESQGIEIDEATNKRLVRKIDLCLGPLMCIIYAVQFMDKTSNSYASVMGLREDLDMKGQQYSWTGTAFYLGYLVAEIPVAFLLQRVPLAKITSGLILIWGMVVCLMAVPNNYVGFETLRTALGMLESGVTPAWVLLTSQWYRTSEQFSRTCFWFAFNGLGTIMGGLIAHAFYERQANIGTPIAAWRLLFLTVGTITISLGIVFFFHIPDVPSKAWFLSKQERLQVVERIRSNQQGYGSRKFKPYQVKEAFCDPRTYLLFAYNIVDNLPNGGLTNFSAIILTSLGYDNQQSLLMNCPSGAIEIVSLIAAGAIAERFQCRMLVAVVCCVVVYIPGLSMLAFCKDQKAALAGYYIWQASPVGFVCLLSCVSSNTAGHTKKLTVQALALISYCIGNMVGPLTFLEEEAPNYTTAKVIMVVCSFLALTIISIIYYINWRENKKRDTADVKLNIENHEFADLTDFENPEFRYAL